MSDFSIKETATRDELIKFATSAATADSEADFAKIVQIANPVYDRQVMGDAFMEAIGYNPIRDFDIHDIMEVIDGMIVDADSAIASALRAKRDEIGERAMQIFDERRDEHMRMCIAMAANEIMGDLGNTVENLLGVTLDSDADSGIDEEDGDLLVGLGDDETTSDDSGDDDEEFIFDTGDDDEED